MGATSFEAIFETDGIHPSEVVVRVTVAGETKEIRLNIASSE